MHPDRFVNSTLIAAIALLVVPVVGRAMGTTALSRVCLGGAYHETCFAPGNVRRAEYLFPLAVDPTTAVRAATGLQLATAIVTRKSVNGSASAIYYGFGDVLPVLGRGAGPGNGNHRYVLVIELRGRIYPFRTIRLDREVGRWYLRANFPRRPLSLIMYGTVSAEAMHAIALGVLRQ